MKILIALFAMNLVLSCGSMNEDILGNHRGEKSNTPGNNEKNSSSDKGHSKSNDKNSEKNSILLPEKEIGFWIDQDGRPRFGIKYSQDYDGVFTIGFSIFGPEIVSDKLIDKMSMRLMLEDSDFATEWKEVIESKTQLIGTYAAVLGANGQEALSIIDTLEKLKVQIRANVEGKSYIRWIRVGQYCTTHPNNFVDISTAKVGCN
ncbi:MAG: hypothetical protein R3B45_18305 [Bdellovibrionota bacterium]